MTCEDETWCNIYLKFSSQGIVKSIGRQQIFLNSRHSRMAEAVKFSPWW